MVEQFYEKYIKDEAIIEKGFNDGKFVQGTLYFDKQLSNKCDAYVKVKGIPQVVKVRGLKHLNRALHLDTVVIKFVNWVQWEKAQASMTKGIDFEEMAEDDPYQNSTKEVTEPLEPVENDGPEADADAAELGVQSDEEQDDLEESKANSEQNDLTSETEYTSATGDEEEGEEEGEEEQYYDEE